MKTPNHDAQIKRLEQIHADAVRKYEAARGKRMDSPEYREFSAAAHKNAVAWLRMYGGC